MKSATTPTTTGTAASADRRRSPCCSTRSPAREACSTSAATTGCSRGDTMLVIVPHNHRYWLEKGGRWEFFWISMSGQEAVRIHRTIQAQAGPVLRLQQRDHRTHRRLQPAPDRRRGRNAGRGLGNRLRRPSARSTTMCSGRRDLESIDDDDAVMRSVVDYVLANLDKPLTVSHLAEVSGFSRAHFSRMFTASKGVPPGEFVLQERMRRAARLLSSHSLLPVKEIADPHRFRRCRTISPRSSAASSGPARPSSGRPACIRLATAFRPDDRVQTRDEHEGIHAEVGRGRWWHCRLACRDDPQRNRAPEKTAAERHRHRSSSQIPIIGVGEASTAAFSFMLRHFGIDPLKFLRETRGSIKLGIRHKDWRRVGHTYHGPIDEPHQMVKGAGDSQFLNVYEIAAGRPVAGLHLFDMLMHRDLSPYRPDGRRRTHPGQPVFFRLPFRQSRGRQIPAQPDPRRRSGRWSSEGDREGRMTATSRSPDP